MPNYSNGKIYKIIDESNGDIYIGSTVQELRMRFLTHGMFKRYNKNKNNCKIILIERYPCKSKRELEIKEQYWMDNIICINKTRAYREKYFHDEQARKRSRKWKKNNNERSAEYYKKRWRYQSSWGGCLNNLLNIDPDLFNY